MDLTEVPADDFLRHPWEVARAAFFASELRRAGLLGGPRRLLDVGAGDAWLSRELGQMNPAQLTTCWDPGYAERTPPPTDRVSYSAGRPDGSFDTILMLDVAEHVADDGAFLAEVLDCAAAGAHVLFSVPAWPWLYSNHDEALRHYRRYTPRSAKRLLTNAGLTIERSGGLFHSLLGPRALGRLAQRRDPDRTFDPATPVEPEDLAWTHGRLLRGAILGALSVDALVTKATTALGVDAPGLSWWALCRTP